VERKFRESGDSPTHCELFWRPGGSIGFLIDLFGFFKLTMVVVREREMHVFNISAPGPDYITWRHLKLILANSTCAVGVLSLANACLSLWHWPRHFKESVSVIIPKLGKLAYNTPGPLGLLFCLTL